MSVNVHVRIFPDDLATINGIVAKVMQFQQDGDEKPISVLHSSIEKADFGLFHVSVHEGRGAGNEFVRTIYIAFKDVVMTVPLVPFKFTNNTTDAPKGPPEPPRIAIAA